jgi:glutamate racemase
MMPRTHFFKIPAPRIAVLDSGVGGLSVAAELAAVLEQQRNFAAAEVFFVNVLFENASGYNRLKTHAERVSIFNNALAGVRQKIAPDLILIACNTLSVIYPETAFSQTTPIPVIGILDAGTRLLLDPFRQTPAAKVIIFGTRMTIEPGTYQRRLIAAGIRPDQIVGQACPELADSIETGAESERTRELIWEYVTAAFSQADFKSGEFFVSLNCTHFGYAMKGWKTVFQELNCWPLAILNPNSAMLDFLKQPEVRHRFSETRVKCRVISKVEFRNFTLNSIGGLIQKTSPAMFLALQNYKWVDDLFEWKSLVSQ